MKSKPLGSYVSGDAINHFRHLGPHFKSVLHDIKVLSEDTRQHSGMRGDIYPKIMGWPGTDLVPRWPTARHDFLFYILIAFAPNSLLQAHLRHSAFEPKAGTNPLVYAAYFNKDEHARTLLSRGARLNDRGWEPNNSCLALPIEVALVCRHYGLVPFFVVEGCAVPSYIFGTSLFGTGIPTSVARMLLQTDDFAEAMNNSSGGLVEPQPVNILQCYGNNDERDLINIIRRLHQLGGALSPGTLYVAVRTRNWQMIRTLLGTGFNERVCTAGRNSVFQVALELFGEDDHCLETLKFLIGHGYDPLEACPSGKTPLHIAVDRNHIPAARYLLSIGVPISPNLLFVAVRKRNLQQRTPMIHFLLENGANVHARTAAGDSLLYVALESFSEDDHCLETVKLLIGHGCDPFEACLSGKTPLHIAVHRDRIPAVQYLLSLGVPLSPDLLFVAVGMRNQQKRASMTHLLLENGANVHACTASGDSLLHVALESFSEDDHCLETVELLIGHGCDPRKASFSRKPPLRIAVERGHVRVARYLLSLGVPPPSDLLFVALCLRDQQKIAPMIVCLLENGNNIHTHTGVGDSVLNMALQPISEDVHCLEIVKCLIGHGCNPREASSSGKTPLYIAVELGRVSIAQYLLSLDIPPPSDLLFVALRIRVQQKRAPMIRLLLENGANVHARTAAGDSVLHVALESFSEDSYSLETLKILAGHGCDPLEARPSGETPLHIAVELGCISFARYVLSLGATPSPDLLFAAARMRDQEKKAPMIHFLLENGAGVHARTTAGDSVLHVALESFSEDNYCLRTVKLLIGHGCDPREVSSLGKTPFHTTVERGHISVAKCFLSNCASSILPCDILLVALNSNRFRRKLQMVNFLIDGGASVFAKVQNGDTVLHAAVASLVDDEVLEGVVLLLRRGCDPSVSNIHGATPLHIAIRRRHTVVVKHFLSLKVPLPPDILFTAIQYKPTPSWWVSEMEIIEALVAAGCDTQTRNAAGHTPLDAAAMRGHSGVADYLLRVSMASTSPEDLLSANALAPADTQEEMHMLRHMATTIGFPPESGIGVRSTAADTQEMRRMLRRLVRSGSPEFPPAKCVRYS